MQCSSTVAKMHETILHSVSMSLQSSEAQLQHCVFSQIIHYYHLAKRHISVSPVDEATLEVLATHMGENASVATSENSFYDVKSSPKARLSTPERLALVLAILPVSRMQAFQEHSPLLIDKLVYAGRQQPAPPPPRLHNRRMRNHYFTQPLLSSHNIR